MSNEKTTGARALMKRLRKVGEAMRAAEAKGDTATVEAKSKEADEMMRDGLAELGFDPADYRRMRGINNEARIGNHDRVMKAIRELSAIATTTRFPTFAAVAHAALDDLNEIARVARDMDLTMDSMDLATGKGGFCQYPQRLDADVNRRLHEQVDGDGRNPEVDVLDRVLDNIVGAMNTAQVEGHEFAPFTLMGLVMLGQRIGKALAPLVEFAGRGNLRTAKALRAMLDAQFRAAKEGETLNKADPHGRELYYWFNGDRTANANALVDVLDYVIEHGSDEGYDLDDAKARLREALVATGDGAALERFDTREAELRAASKPATPKTDSPFHAHHRATH